MTPPRPPLQAILVTATIALAVALPLGLNGNTPERTRLSPETTVATALQHGGILHERIAFFSAFPLPFASSLDLTPLPDHTIVDAYFRYDTNGDFSEGLTLVRSLSGTLLRRITLSPTATVLHDPLTGRRDDRPATDMSSIRQTLTSLARETQSRRAEIEAGDIELRPTPQAGQGLTTRTDASTVYTELLAQSGVELDGIETRNTVWLTDLSRIASEGIGLTPTGRHIQLFRQRTLINEALPLDAWPGILDRFHAP